LQTKVTGRLISLECLEKLQDHSEFPLPRAGKELHSEALLTENGEKEHNYLLFVSSRICSSRKTFIMSAWLFGTRLGELCLHSDDINNLRR
jgi:hypothetical protein